ncbi:hypothetical protein [Nocardia sp. NPDC051570]|uniref:hypothetical protein n=1 Tax=Nocardia sp. NPDC051570 TaxID=3364324 RepID=UPI0037B7DE6F
MGENSKLPQRVVHVDNGGVKHPTLEYTAAPHIVLNFLAALRISNPDYRVEIQPVDDPDGNVPPTPLWQLRAWDCR